MGWDDQRMKPWMVVCVVSVVVGVIAGPIIYAGIVWRPEASDQKHRPEYRKSVEGFWDNIAQLNADVADLKADVERLKADQGR